MRLMSRSVSATKAPYSRATIPSVIMRGAAPRIAGAIKPSPMTMKPYNPAFDCTAETTATIGEGKSAYVSGIQVCSGQGGVFTKNANAKPANTHGKYCAGRLPAAAGTPITSVEPVRIP